MKKLLWMSFCAGLVFPVCAQVVKPAEAGGSAKPTATEAVKPAEAKGLDWDAGADLRVRQEVFENVPLGSVAGKTVLLPPQNWVRTRPRVWGQVKNDDFKLYMRAANETRYYSDATQSSNYRYPEELFLDNLYLDLYNLLDDHLDLRIGRQDFFGATGPTYGAGRVLLDGTPGDGSRTVYMDAIKATVKFDPKNTLDILAIYNSPVNDVNFGRSYVPGGPKERVLTGGAGEKEWGGGLYFKSKEVAQIPFELYYFYKRETKALTARTNRAQPDGRETHTVGTRVMPKLTETLSAEFEGAAQAGQKDSGPATSGYMGYGGLTYKPAVDMKVKPFLTGSIYYLSGDKNQGAGNNDSAWDPLWARWPQLSELFVANNVYGAGGGYWSNLVYPSLLAGLDFAPGHKVFSSVGPMYAATEDNLGGGDGNLRGWLGMARYDFPLAKNIFGKRGELYGHVTAEVLDPGDYYNSDRVAYFLRWEINARF
jgi:hypothetical protein